MVLTGSKEWLKLGDTGKLGIFMVNCFERSCRVLGEELVGGVTLLPCDVCDKVDDT